MLKKITDQIVKNQVRESQMSKISIKNEDFIHNYGSADRNKQMITARIS